MADAFVRVEDLTVRFGSIVALDGVNLTVGADELLVVLGPTGAGKTTLLRTLAGLETPSAGRLVFDEQDITALSPAERDVALVFQNFSLYPDWTVRRNLSFPLQAPGRTLPPEQITERVKWAADMLKIAPLLDRPAVHLSGGEMQRVAIGRAIVRRPRLFLLDEPLSNLDAKLREALRVELVALRRELKMPMIFVTHDQAEALSMGDRIVVLVNGKVRQTGTPEEIYRRPASVQVARLLGQPAINVIRVKRADGHWRTASGVEVAPAEAGSDSEMVCGVRPEDVEIDGGSEPATVRVVEHTGPALILLVRWAEQDLNILVDAKHSIKPGDTIHPRFDPQRVIFWPADEQPVG